MARQSRAASLLREPELFASPLAQPMIARSEVTHQPRKSTGINTLGLPLATSAVWDEFARLPNRERGSCCWTLPNQFKSWLLCILRISWIPLQRCPPIRVLPDSMALPAIPSIEFCLPCCSFSICSTCRSPPALCRFVLTSSAQQRKLLVVASDSRSPVRRGRWRVAARSASCARRLTSLATPPSTAACGTPQRPWWR